MENFPTILISGQHFHRRSGGGITLSNLFYGWKKSNIGAAAGAIIDPSYDVCENYYQFGSTEFKLRFPFSLKRQSVNNTSGVFQNKTTEDILAAQTPMKKSLLRHLYDKVLYSSGLIHYRSKFLISESFLKWTKDLAPDIIYSQLSSLEEIKIVTTLHNVLGLPLVIHIMDDWPSTISDRYFPKLIWRRIISKRFVHLLSKADVLFSISDAMSEEYQKRYGLDFTPFHNPIDIDAWLPHVKKEHNLKEDLITVLYSGRIGTGIANSLLDVAEAIESFNQSEQRIELHIQTAIEEHDILLKLRKFKCVVINPAVDYSQIPGIFSSADILILANDFDAKARKFLKFSMPTKASEYMISGTPILVYSAEETAVTRFFSKNQCGYCVTRQGVDEIREAIKHLISDERCRKEISSNAVRLAIEKFDATKVREEFRSILREVCRNKKHK